jgi:hypothetical protein
VVRLFFVRGPFDGGSADFEREDTASRSRKANRRGEESLPTSAFVMVGNGCGVAWAYRLSRTLTPFSAEYTLTGWVDCDNLPRNATIVVIPRNN